MTDVTIPTMSLSPVPPSASPIKPGWRTSEFWLKCGAMVLTMLYASGAIPTSGTSTQVTAIAATILGALGYTVSRTMVKTS